MKKISINQVVSITSKQPFTANSLKFLQDALDEDKAGIIKAFISQNLGTYSLTTPYVISGCVVSDSGKDVTAGEVFYGGKYYETTAVNGTTNIAQFVLTKTQDAIADPVIFTDSASKNVHDIYKFVATDTATSGTFDSSDLVSAYEDWLSWTPTLTATNNVGANVPSGFLATITKAEYLYNAKTLDLIVELASIDTLASSYNLQLTLPITVPSPTVATSYGICNYNDGSSSFLTDVRVRLSHTGAGTALTISKVGGAAFGVTTGGSVSFSLRIGLV